MTKVEHAAALKAEQQLAEDLRAYEGQWVAVRDHEVVAHAATLDELVETVEGIAYDAILSVPEEALAGAFF